MRTIVRLFGIFAIAVSLAGCGFFDSGTNWQFGDFQIGWIDTRSNSSLSYRLDSSSSIGIVGACVFAAGANDQYVVVAQRPVSSPATVNYYLLSRARYDPQQDPEKALTGPLSASAYRTLSQQLSLPMIQLVIPEAVCGGAAA